MEDVGGKLTAASERLATAGMQCKLSSGVILVPLVRQSQVRAWHAEDDT